MHREEFSVEMSLEAFLLFQTDRIFQGLTGKNHAAILNSLCASLDKYLRNDEKELNYTNFQTKRAFFGNDT